MTQIQKEALLNYIEFGLTALVEGLTDHLNEEGLGRAYDDAYILLNDFDETFQTLVDQSSSVTNQ